MNFLYNTGIALYSLGVKTVASFGHRKAMLMTAGQNSTFRQIDQWVESLGGKRPVWFHAASLGEFEQGRPVIERLRRDYPEIPIVLSFFSSSGYEVRKNYQGVDLVVYLPFDTPSNARRFVDMLNPLAAVFVKYEFWGNYLAALSRKNVPVFLISAIFHPNQPFFKKWGGMFRKMLDSYNTFFVQSEQSARLLESACVDKGRIVVSGDTRFDRVTDNLKSAPKVEAVERWVAADPGKFTFIAGSSWEPDEEIYAGWVSRHPDVRVIIAPHEFNEARLAALEQKFGPGVERFSSVSRFNEIKPDTRVLIIDCFGLLATLYRYGSMAYVGGGFGTGIHSVAEAAVYNIPVVFGPRHKKFKEACDLIAEGGGFSVDTVDSFDELADKFYSDPEARRQAGDKAGGYIAANLGATDKVMEHLSRFL